MTNDIQAIETQFFRSLGDGTKAAVYLQQLVQAVVTSRDTSILVKAIDRAENDKRDEQAGKVIRAVVRAIWPGAKMSKDKNGQPRITIKGIEADTTAIAALNGAVKDNLSFRHHTFLKRISPPSEDKVVSFTDKNVEAFLKRAAKAGVNLTAAVVMVQTKAKAMQEEARLLAAGEEPAH